MLASELFWTQLVKVVIFKPNLLAKLEQLRRREETVILAAAFRIVRNFRGIERIMIRPKLILVFGALRRVRRRIRFGAEEREIPEHESHLPGVHIILDDQRFGLGKKFRRRRTGTDNRRTRSSSPAHSHYPRIASREPSVITLVFAAAAAGCCAAALGFAAPPIFAAPAPEPEPPL